MDNGKIIRLITNFNETIEDLFEKIKKKVKGLRELNLYKEEEKKTLLTPSLTINQLRIKNNSTIFLEEVESEIEEGQEIKEINIQFFRLPSNKKLPNYNTELTSLLKLSLLKEIANKFENVQIEKLTGITQSIMKILKNGFVPHSDNMKEDIKKIIEKAKGGNLINFSNFVDNTIDITQLYNLMQLLNKKDFLEIKDIKNRLSRFEKEIKLFNKQFSDVMKDSIIEFSVISVAVVEREDLEEFESDKKKCPNRVDKLLFHGTGEEALSSILTGKFWKSEKKCYQHGKGVYFSDKLDYCWFYGNKYDNRINKNKIPQKNETFTLIACSTYYNNGQWRHVCDCKYDPKLFDINFAYAGSEFETLVKPDEKKFYGTEYVIGELSQICPFLGVKLKRVEYCCIWRDNNFSKNPVYNNEYDDLFKKFLAKRVRYIEQYAECNIYPCQTSEEALKLIGRKKYNKIILLSNIGSDLGGKKFIDEARKIIGNDIVVLFLAYNINHLKWVKNYKNALFSNDPDFYEEYLQCFSSFNDNEDYSDEDIMDNILTLKDKMESYYNVRFNFTNDFLNYPNFKDSGKYSDLRFD